MDNGKAVNKLFKERNYRDYIRELCQEFIKSSPSPATKNLEATKIIIYRLLSEEWREKTISAVHLSNLGPILRQIFYLKKDRDTFHRYSVNNLQNAHGKPDEITLCYPERDNNPEVLDWCRDFFTFSEIDSPSMGQLVLLFFIKCHRAVKDPSVDENTKSDLLMLMDYLGFIIYEMLMLFGVCLHGHRELFGFTNFLENAELSQELLLLLTIETLKINTIMRTLTYEAFEYLGGCKKITREQAEFELPKNCLSSLNDCCNRGEYSVVGDDKAKVDEVWTKMQVFEDGSSASLRNFHFSTFILILQLLSELEKRDPGSDFSGIKNFCNEIIINLAPPRGKGKKTLPRKNAGFFYSTLEMYFPEIVKDNDFRAITLSPDILGSLSGFIKIFRERMSIKEPKAAVKIEETKEQRQAREAILASLIAAEEKESKKQLSKEKGKKKDDNNKKNKAAKSSPVKSPEVKDPAKAIPPPEKKVETKKMPAPAVTVVEGLSKHRVATSLPEESTPLEDSHSSENEEEENNDLSETALPRLLKSCEKFLKQAEILLEAMKDQDPAENFQRAIQEACEQTKAMIAQIKGKLPKDKRYALGEIEPLSLSDPVIAFKRALSIVTWELQKFEKGQKEAHPEISAFIKDNLTSGQGLPTLFYHPLSTYFSPKEQEDSYLFQVYRELKKDKTMWLKGSRVLFPGIRSPDWDMIVFPWTSSVFEFMTFIYTIDQEAQMVSRGPFENAKGRLFSTCEVKFRNDELLDVTLFHNALSPADVMQQLEETSVLMVASAYYSLDRECLTVLPSTAKGLYRAQKGICFGLCNEEGLLPSKKKPTKEELLEQKRAERTAVEQYLSLGNERLGFILRTRIKFLEYPSLRISVFMEKIEEFLKSPATWTVQQRELVEKALHYLTIHLWKAPQQWIRYIADMGLMQVFLPEITAGEWKGCLEYFQQNYKPDSCSDKKTIAAVSMALLFAPLLNDASRREVVLAALDRFCKQFFYYQQKDGSQIPDTRWLDLLQLFQRCPVVSDFKQIVTPRNDLPKKTLNDLKAWQQMLETPLMSPGTGGGKAPVRSHQAQTVMYGATASVSNAAGGSCVP
jgi:hypothetical protein